MSDIRDHPTWRAIVDAHFRLQSMLPMWVVYSQNTLDYPGIFVARMHLTLPEAKPTEFVMTHPSLNALRSILPPGMVKLDRSPEDDATIIEVWI
jgi:hypothetical protein